MNQWYEKEPERLTREKEAARRYLADVFFPKIGDGGDLQMVGRLAVTFRERMLYDIRLRFVYPSDFLQRGRYPKVLDHDHVFDWDDAESHINSDGSFCLGIIGTEELQRVSQPSYSLAGFLQYVRVYLAGQYVYQHDKRRAMLHGGKARWPGQAWSHGQAGIEEALREAGPNSLCPCGSGKKRKHCQCGLG